MGYEGPVKAIKSYLKAIIEKISRKFVGELIYEFVWICVGPGTK